MVIAAGKAIRVWLDVHRRRFVVFTAKVVWFCEATRTMTANEVYNLRLGFPLILLQFSPDHKGSLSIIIGRHLMDIADR